MSKRHEKIGIKQVIRLEWMDKTLDMLLAGMHVKNIRSELKHYLSDKKQSGGTGERGEKTYIMAISVLMKTWCEPDEDIKQLRDDALVLAGKINSENRLPLHWAMISAAYPFWEEVAKQTGRLLNLQDRITFQQIIRRLKEQYGDRQTISRYARYVIRSFVSCGVLQDSMIKGCYERGESKNISDHDTTLLLLESGLLASAESKGYLSILLSRPSLFPFSLPLIGGDFVVRNSSRINVVRYSLDDELLDLKANQK